jgi:hypothetical protein
MTNGLRSGGWSREKRERGREIERKRKTWGGLGFSSNANKRPVEVSELLT